MDVGVDEPWHHHEIAEVVVGQAPRVDLLDHSIIEYDPGGPHFPFDDDAIGSDRRHARTLTGYSGARHGLTYGHSVRLGS